MADEPKADASLPPGWTVVGEGITPKEAPLPEGFINRTLAAIGPAIRGAGDVTGANWLLENTGLVPEGRLTGPEQNARDTQTRSTTGFGGGAMMLANAPKTLMGAAEGLRNATAPIVEPYMEPIWEAIKKRLGADPEEIGLQGTKRDLESARATSRQMGLPPLRTAMRDAGATNAASPSEVMANGTPVQLRSPGRVPGRLVLTPEEAQAAQQLKGAYRPGASLEGMKSAARANPAETPTLEDLIDQLSKQVH